MSDNPDPERLKQLEARLKKAAGEVKQEDTSDAAYNQASFAWQMVIELTVGLLIGFGIGFGLDTLFGTKPIFMVLFIMLGFAAGVKVMLSTAAQMQKKAAEAQDAQTAAEEKGNGRG
ncbi:AtpZ/AtpI family protein [Aliiroseovarius sediminis]|uniref:AtpZ/AtpI family protein n=1 Tax=Aliiroseovarius sediminis TaxID=2925839 RepID=UPI001F55FC5D|nr:AtpZ/AtpI family protein [Aliiroseovarius sediminis]MCI2394186.1 AtpZ/AtpI family protein [Aliiroseovarius sediminis]